MKKIAVIAILAVTLTGCAGSVTRFKQGFEKQVNGGYQARVKLYTAEGKAIQTWEGKMLPINDGAEDPSLTFIMDDKKVTLFGVYTIEEL